MSYPEDTRIALYGITGTLGREVQSALEVDHEGISTLLGAANIDSVGDTIRWRGRALSIFSPQDMPLPELDIAILATPPEVANAHIEALQAHGIRTIDASNATPDALMTWPQLAHTRDHDIAGADHLSLPHPIVSTLAPILDALTYTDALPPLRGIHLTALMSATFAGKSGIAALSKQAVGLLNFRPAVDAAPFPDTLAFNVTPFSAKDAQATQSRVQAEVRRLFPKLQDTELSLSPLWVGAFSGLSLHLSLDFAEAPDTEFLQRILTAHPDLTLHGDDTDEDTEVCSMRAAMNAETVHLPQPQLHGSTLVLNLFADPTERSAQAITRLIRTWIAPPDLA